MMVVASGGDIWQGVVVVECGGKTARVWWWPVVVVWQGVVVVECGGKTAS